MSTTPKFSTSFPALKSVTRLNGFNKRNEPTSFFDVKFYPYTRPGDDPVFALIGKGEIIVARPTGSDSASIEIIAQLHDQDPKASLNSIAWTYDRLTGAPLLCTAGQNAAVNILNVSTGKLVKTLTGHGKDINDLAISPLSPWILASVSLDCSVRIWSLDPGHAEQPCTLICAGEGHKIGILCSAFHQSGRYLLTGGMDNVVNIWVIPDLPNNDANTSHPTMIHYPHFSTDAVHSSVVDCLTFHGDLIISRSAEEDTICVWLVEGFDSNAEPPGRAPTTHEVRSTRSAWGGGYQILFKLDAPETPSYWMRFGLFDAIGHRPILAMGDSKSKVNFWDLKALQEYSEDEPPQITLPRRPRSVTEVHDAMKAEARKLYSTDDPFQPIQAHHDIIIPKVFFLIRQIAWDRSGQWMVVVGDEGMIAVFHRQAHDRED